MPEIILLGAGGHALVVADAATAAGHAVAGCLDDDESPTLATGDPRAPRLGPLDDLSPLDHHAWIIAIGDLGRRRVLIDRIDGRPHEGPGPTTVIHPRAVVAPSAALGRAVLVAPGAVVNARARVHDHAILNSSCVVEHECEIGENAHVAPGAVLGGRVRVGRDALIGLGSRILPGVSVGSRSVVGAGAVVARDVPDAVTVTGIPAVRRG